ncbi:MAG: MFS transporter [Spirochaetota bacterium]
MNTLWRRNLAFAWIAQILSLSGFGFAFPFIPFFIQELGVTDPEELRLWTGMIASAPALSMAIMAPIWGLLADRMGRKLMMLRAMLFGAIILAGLSLSQTVTTVFVLRVAQGLFTGTITAAATLVASGTPPEKMSSALGLLSSSNFIGISVGPLLGGLASELLGYRQSFVIGAVIMMIGFLMVLLFIRETREDIESDTGAAGSRASSPPPEQRSSRQILLSAVMLGSLVMLLLLRFARALPVPFLPLYVQELLGGLKGAASMTGVVSAARGAATALAAVTITRLGDRHPKMKIATVLLLLASVFSVPVALAPTLGWFTVLIVIATFFLGGIEPLLQAQISELAPPRRRGFIFGIQTTVGNVGWFAAPLVGSAVSIRYGVNMIFLALAIFLIAAMIIAGALHVREIRRAG